MQLKRDWEFSKMFNTLLLELDSADQLGSGLAWKEVGKYPGETRRETRHKESIYFNNYVIVTVILFCCCVYAIIKCRDLKQQNCLLATHSSNLNDNQQLNYRVGFEFK